MQPVAGLSPVWAGTLGAALTTWVTFAPCFFFIFLGAPFIEALRGNRVLNAALGAITAAVVGVIMNLAVWFAQHTLFAQQARVWMGPVGLDVPVLASVDWWAVVLAAAAGVAIFRLGAGVITTLAACAAAGLALQVAGLRG